MQIRRLRELVEQLLDLSRLDAEAVVIRPQRVRVRERLEEIVRSVSPLETVEIELEVDPSLEAELDVDALDRIVSNLILNACRYGEPPVLVSAATEHGTLRVTVQDRGPGVPGGVRAAALRPLRPQRRERRRAREPGSASRSRARMRGRTAGRSATTRLLRTAPRSSSFCPLLWRRRPRHGTVCPADVVGRPRRRG